MTRLCYSTWVYCRVLGPLIILNKWQGRGKYAVTVWKPQRFINGPYWICAPGFQTSQEGPGHRKRHRLHPEFNGRHQREMCQEAGGRCNLRPQEPGAETLPGWKLTAAQIHARYSYSRHHLLIQSLPKTSFISLWNSLILILSLYHRWGVLMKFVWRFIVYYILSGFTGLKIQLE